MISPYLSLSLVLLSVAALSYAAVVFGMARLLLSPPRMDEGRAMVRLGRRSPADLGLPFQDVRFAVRDERTGRPLAIAAWWIEHPAGGPRCAVLLHGYSDSKIGAIAWAPLLRSLGYHVLAIDLRAHGESGGRYTSAGFWERHDVAQVVDQIRQARPAQTAKLVLFGVSLGAAVAAATAALRDDLTAVVLEGPFNDFPAAVRRQSDRIGMPGPLFQKAALRLAQAMTGGDFDAVAPAKVLATLRVPVVLIQAADDPFLSEDDLRALSDALKSRPADCGPSVTWLIDGCHHVVGMAEHPDEYRRRVGAFLADATGEPSVPPDAHVPRPAVATEG